MSGIPTCGELQRLLDDYVEETLPASLRMLLRAHLAACSGCSRAVEARTCMRQLLRRLPRAQMPQLMHHRLCSALRTPAPALPRTSPQLRSEQAGPIRTPATTTPGNTPTKPMDRRTS